MTFSLTIVTYQKTLLRLVVALMATAGMVSGEVMDRLPRRVRLAILNTLRPVEAAAVRLIVLAAQEMATRTGGLKHRAKSQAPTGPIPRGDCSRVPSLPLFDPRKRFASGIRRSAKGAGPRISFFDGFDPVIEPEKPALLPDDPVDGTRLCRRLLALQAALGDLSKQGRRLMQRQARREKSGARPVRAIRPGRPPGHRARGRREVDVILRECHLLALEALAPPDTS